MHVNSYLGLLNGEMPVDLLCILNFVTLDENHSVCLCLIIVKKLNNGQMSLKG